jgi:hypothetical protein
MASVTNIQNVWRAVAVAAVSLSLSAATQACGSSDDEPLTKRDFINQGSIICHRWEQEREEALGEAFAEVEGKKVTQQMKEDAVIKVLLRPYQRMTDRLAELSPPEGDEQKVKAVLRAMKETAANIEENPGTSLSSAVQFDKADKLAASYGLTDCKY